MGSDTGGRGRLWVAADPIERPHRNVSAEIFVVCRDFLAPKHIDPKFLDPRHVFKDLASSIAPAPGTGATGADGSAAAPGAVVTNPGATAGLASVNIFAPEKKKRNRAGYADNDFTLYRECSVRDFIHASLADAATLLGSYNRLSFAVPEGENGEADEAAVAEMARWRASRHTTDEVVRNCEDLKVLGKGDFKRLLKWRLALRLEVGLDVKKKDTAEATEEAVVEPVDEEEELTEEVRPVVPRRFDAYKLMSFASGPVRCKNSTARPSRAPSGNAAAPTKRSSARSSGCSST